MLPYPSEAKDKVNVALGQKGFNLDLSKVKAEEVEAIIDSLRDLTVDVDDGKDKVRVFCE